MRCSGLRWCLRRISGQKGEELLLRRRLGGVKSGAEGTAFASRSCQPLWIVWILIALQMHVFNSKEYCLLESFEPSCSEQSFILMLSAFYGRMRVGRCLKRDYYLQCSRDVTAHLDLQCSGKTYCRVLIPEQNLLKYLPCPGDLVAYLEADYTCIRASVGSAQQCLESRFVSATELVGYLTTRVASVAEIGSELCPWKIQAGPGQRINLTLINLNTLSLENASSSSSSSSSSKSGSSAGLAAAEHPGRAERCSSEFAAATVTETLEGGDTVAKKLVCVTTSARLTSVYASRGNSLTVALSSAFRRDFNNTSKFILKYEVIGCREPDTPVGGHLRRSGDRAVIACTGLRRSWNLTCRDHEWIGQVGECKLNQDFLTKTASVTVGDTSMDFFTSGMHVVGMWTALAIGVTVGVAVGICLLIALYSLQQRCAMKRESLLVLGGESREQTGTYSSARRRACARRVFRFSRRSGSDDDDDGDEAVRMRYIQHSQHVCPHWMKNRTIDAAIYIDCPQMAADSNSATFSEEKCLPEETDSCLIGLKRPSLDSQDTSRNTTTKTTAKTLTNQQVDDVISSGLYSQSETLVKTTNGASTQSRNSITFSIANQVVNF